MSAWFQTEVARLKFFGREVALRRVHLTTLLLLVVGGLLVGLGVGVFGGHYVYPYKTVPAPPVPKGQVVPNCGDQPAKQHRPGSCLPQKPKSGTNSGVHTTASITSTTIGPDLSNNDPVYGDGPWSGIGSRSSWAVFKVNEGTGFVDSTAANMAYWAKRHGVIVGGYDFLHVCGDDPTTEADVFVNNLYADGLTGANTLPPYADAEVGGDSCDARSWMESWYYEVWHRTGRVPGTYTGAWWWNPHLGCYWHSGSLAWISGYQVSYPSMPCGRSTLDQWQFADNGYNGYSYADLSTWRDGASAFATYTNGQPPVDQRSWDMGFKTGYATGTSVPAKRGFDITFHPSIGPKSATDYNAGYKIGYSKGWHVDAANGQASGANTPTAPTTYNGNFKLGYNNGWAIQVWQPFYNYWKLTRHVSSNATAFNTGYVKGKPAGYNSDFDWGYAYGASGI